MYKTKSQFNKPKATKEKNNGKTNVEKGGYRTAKQQITAMLSAGQRLSSYREEQYDGKEGADLPVNPTRNPGFDLADASQIAHQLNTKHRATSKAVKKHGKAQKEFENTEIPPSNLPQVKPGESSKG